MEQIRLEFEDWYSRQKRDQSALWHSVESLKFDKKKYPNGRYTTMSQKQSNWEVWQAAWNKAKEDNTSASAVIDNSEAKNYNYTSPLTPNNSSRNHINAEIENESKAKELGIRYIPEDEGEFWTINQIIQYMIKHLSDGDVLAILECEHENDIYRFHSSVGRWIRNTFKLWDLENPNMDGMHPDEMSTEILKEIWRAVQRRERLGL